MEAAVLAERQQLPDAKRAYDDALKACASAYDLKREARLTEGTAASLQLDRAVEGGGDGGGGGFFCGGCGDCYVNLSCRPRWCINFFEY